MVSPRPPQVVIYHMAVIARYKRLYNLRCVSDKVEAKLYWNTVNKNGSGRRCRHIDGLHCYKPCAICGTKS